MKKTKQEIPEKIWERWKGEPHKAHGYFQYYLSLSPPRSIEDVATHFDKTTNHMYILSSRWEWNRRVEAYTTHVQEDLRRASEEEFFYLQREALLTELEISEILYENMKELHYRQRGKEKFSPSTVANILFRHEKAMTEHIHNFYLLCGQPDIINPVDQGDQNRVIPEYQTDEELKDKLDLLLEEGSAEEGGTTQQEDKE